MKQQIIRIGGGVPKENFPSFAAYVKNISFNPFEIFSKNWSDNLQNDLGEKYEVIHIPMPNKGFADYESWENHVGKIIGIFAKMNHFITTSLGFTFLLKYLSLGKKIPVSISKVFFLAPALHDSEDELLGSFSFDLSKISNCETMFESIFIYHSTDDRVVPFQDGLELKSYFPKTIFREFSERGHFFLESKIPEILEDIKA